MAEAIRQGFICPFCMADLGDFPRLQAHVENAHPEESSADLTSVVQNVKGLFDKAKRGIRKLDAKMSVDLTQVNQQVSSGISDLTNMASVVQEKVQEKRKTIRPPPVVYRPPPPSTEIGIRHSHTSDFRRFRDSCVNESAVRTNTLIIRMDRLINECPNDQSKRKAFEREVVPWSEDAESIYCRTCAAKFGLTKRRHHCRLCGRVMCHSCSKFLSFLSARKLTNPALAAQMIANEEAAAAAMAAAAVTEEAASSSPLNGRKLLEVTAKTTVKMRSFLEGAVSKIQGAASGVVTNAETSGGNDGSELSLGSLLQQDASECLRVCISCMRDLKRREDMMEQSKESPLTEQYNTLNTLLADVSSLSPSYARMAQSLNSGETMYPLKNAEEVRQKLYQKQREIDKLSDRIAAEGEVQGCPIKEASLRRNIRIMAIQTLQSVFTSMPTLPTAEEYEKYVEQRQKAIERQVEATRNAHLQQLGNEQRIKPSASMPQVSTAASSSTSSPATTHRTASTERRSNNFAKRNDEGWTPMPTRSHNPFLDEEDMQHPMYEQADIIRGYLMQAIEAGRLEEVEMLERSLKDLEEEMTRMGLAVK